VLHALLIDQHLLHPHKLVRAAVQTVKFDYVANKTVYRLEGCDFEEAQLVSDIVLAAMRVAEAEQENALFPLLALQIVGSLLGSALCCESVSSSQRSPLGDHIGCYLIHK
jgi:hypothetical protein